MLSGRGTKGKEWGAANLLLTWCGRVVGRLIEPSKMVAFRGLFSKVASPTSRELNALRELFFVNVPACPLARPRVVK